MRDSERQSGGSYEIQRAPAAIFDSEGNAKPFLSPHTQNQELSDYFRDWQEMQQAQQPMLPQAPELLGMHLPAVK